MGIDITPVCVVRLARDEGCPTQFYGETGDGRRLYVRHRHGRVSVRLSENVQDNEYVAPAYEVYRFAHGDEFGCEISTAELIRATQHLFDWANTACVTIEPHNPGER